MQSNVSPLSSSSLDLPLPSPSFAPSSLEEITLATSSPSTSLRPKLSPYPPLCPEVQFISLLNQIGASLREHTGITVERLGSLKLDLEFCSKEVATRLKENAEKMSQSGMWGILQKIATTLSVLVLGQALLTVGGGTVVGGMMIASGVLGISHLILTESQGFTWLARQLAGEDDKRREQIEFYLPSILAISSIVLGLSGSALALSIPGAIRGALQGKFTLTLGSVIQVFQAGSTLGSGLTQSRLLAGQAELTSSTGQKMLITTSLEELVSSLNHSGEKEFLGTFQNFVSKIEENAHNLTRNLRV